MYIIDPISLNTYSIKNKCGIKVLKSYIYQYQLGGSGSGGSGSAENTKLVKILTADLFGQEKEYIKQEDIFGEFEYKIIRGILGDMLVFKVKDPTCKSVHIQADRDNIKSFYSIGDDCIFNALSVFNIIKPKFSSALFNALLRARQLDPKAGLLLNVVINRAINKKEKSMMPFNFANIPDPTELSEILGPVLNNNEGILLIFTYKTGSGHIVSLIKENGDLFILDKQTNQKIQYDGYDFTNITKVHSFTLGGPYMFIDGTLTDLLNRPHLSVDYE